MNEPRYAWSDAPEQVLLCPYGRPQDPQYRFSPQMAKEVYDQLGKAIEQAEQTPFLRWWMQRSSCDCPEGFRLIIDRKFHKAEAEALFNSIREAQ